MLPKINKTTYLTAGAVQTKLAKMNEDHHNREWFKLSRWNKIKPKTSTWRGPFKFHSEVPRNKTAAGGGRRKKKKNSR